MAMASALEETIATQPEQLERSLAIDLTAAVEKLSGAVRIWLVGTGTSQHAAELGAWMLQDAGRDARWRSSATFARHGPELGEADGVIVISHTTESSFARAARARAAAADARLVSITGFGRGWAEAIETAPREMSETYTASYTTALMVLARLSIDLGESSFGPEQLAAIPQRALAALSRAQAPEAPVPERALVIAGVGPAAVTAREGAVKLREAARILSEGYEAENLLHGSAVPLDHRDALLLLCPESDPDRLLALMGEAARDAGVTVASLSEPGGLHPVLEQIPLTIRLQCLAARAAELRAQDPDRVIVGPWAGTELWAAGAPD